MFCPKCGSEDSNETKFCRVCGTDLSNVLAIINGSPLPANALSEKNINLFSSGLRGLMIGVGFLIVSGVSFAISIRLAVLGVFSLAFAFCFLSVGISRLVQANRIKKLSKRDEPPALSTAQTEYIKPLRSIYETDDLIAHSFSVTDHTTKHLK